MPYYVGRQIPLDACVGIPEEPWNWGESTMNEVLSVVGGCKAVISNQN